MGRKTPRLAMWALAILTSFALVGNHTAYADSHGPRVNAGGQFTTPNPDAPAGSAKVTFGVDGKYKHDATPDGHFEYFNHSSGLHAHGRINTLTFGTASPSCVFFGGDQLAGKPSATVSGQCDDGSCSFSMELVDAGKSPKRDGQDFVCNVNVNGQGKMHLPASDSDPAEPVIHGNVEIHNQ